MTFQELIEIVQDYTDATHSDLYMNVNFGCDCGCGGDMYDLDSWQEMESATMESIAAMKKLCETLGIVYEGKQ